MASNMMERETGEKLIPIEGAGNLKKPSTHMSDSMLGDFLVSLNYKKESVVMSRSHVPLIKYD